MSMSLCAYIEIMSILYLFLDSSSDDDSIFGEDQNRDFLRGGRLRDSGASSSSYSDHSPHHQGREQRPQSAMFFVPGNTSRQAVTDIHHSRHCEYILYLQYNYFKFW